MLCDESGEKVYRCFTKEMCSLVQQGNTVLVLDIVNIVLTDADAQLPTNRHIQPRSIMTIVQASSRDKLHLKEGVIDGKLRRSYLRLSF